MTYDEFLKSIKQFKPVQRKFLILISRGYSHQDACKGAIHFKNGAEHSLSEDTEYNWQRLHPEYKAAVQAAREYVAPALEACAMACAFKAPENARYTQLLYKMLAANNPQKYGERITQIVERADPTPVRIIYDDALPNTVPALPEPPKNE